MTKRLIITVGRDGSVRAETKGVFGSACLDDVGLLEDLLDATTVDSQFTEDYHRTAEQAPRERWDQEAAPRRQWEQEQ